MTRLNLDLSGIHNLGFLLGVAGAWLLMNGRTPSRARAALVLAIGGTGLLLSLLTEAASGVDIGMQGARTEIGRSFLYTLSAGLTVYGLAAFEKASRWRIGEFATLAGGGSYVLYLVHEPPTSLVIKILSVNSLRDFVTPNRAYVLSVGIAVGASVWLHLKVEKPLSGYLRRCLLSNRRDV